MLGIGALGLLLIKRRKRLEVRDSAAVCAAPAVVLRSMGGADTTCISYLYVGLPFLTVSEKEISVRLKSFPIFHGFRLVALVLTVAAFAGLPGIASASARVIAIHNPSFEDNTTPSPGYGAIKDWKSTDTAATGVNTGSGAFADNGAIPNGSQVAFIQSSNGKAQALSQNLSGFIPGKRYVLRFYYNARYATYAANPKMVVKLGSSTLTPAGGVTITPVSKQTDTTPYHAAKYYYTATGRTAKLIFSNINTGKNSAGNAYNDSTILLDDVSLRAVSAKLHHK